MLRIRDPGSGIGYLFDPGIRAGRKSASGSAIRDEQPGSYFLELRNHFFCFLGVKILKFFDEDPGSGMETVRIRDPGWKKVGSGIRDKHPGSATLVELYTGIQCVWSSFKFYTVLFQIFSHFLFSLLINWLLYWSQPIFRVWWIKSCFLSVADSVFGIRNRFFPDPGSQTNIFKCCVTIFWVKNLFFFEN